MAGPRNSFGVNDTTDCYRTVGSEKYAGWGGGMSAARTAAYRAARVCCRRFGDDVYVYVREADTAKAIGVNGQLGPDY